MDNEEMSKVLCGEFVGPPQPARIVVIGLGSNGSVALQVLEKLMQEGGTEEVLRQKFPNHVIILTAEEMTKEVSRQVMKMGLVEDERRVITESLKKTLKGTVIATSPYKEENLNRQISTYIPNIRTGAYLRKQARNNSKKKQGRR